MHVLKSENICRVQFWTRVFCSYIYSTCSQLSIDIFCFQLLLSGSHTRVMLLQLMLCCSCCSFSFSCGHNCSHCYCCSGSCCHCCCSKGYPAVIEQAPKDGCFEGLQTVCVNYLLIAEAAVIVVGGIVPVQYCQ